MEKVDSIEKMAEGDRKLKEFTVNKIKELAKGNQPFFLEHAFMKVHADNFASKAFEGKSASKYPYKESVVEVDAYVGEIVKALEEAGVLENTFIFITSDNGPQLDTWPDGGYTPFRGAKASAWEGGVRVPGIAYWKGMISPGRQSDELFDLMDLFNTSLRSGRSCRARSRPTDISTASTRPRFSSRTMDTPNVKRSIIWYEHDLMAMRMYEYKIHVKVVQSHAQWLDIDMTTVSNVGLAPWLFNLYIDPKEQYPVGHRMNAWLASMASEMKDHAATFKKYPPKNIGLGQ